MENELYLLLFILCISDYKEQNINNWAQLVCSQKV